MSRFSFYVAAVAAVLTPGAYLLGLSYYQGYLSAFGVEPDAFQISSSDVYVYSYQTVGYFLLALAELSINAINKVFSPPIVYWAGAILVIFAGVIYLLLKIVRSGLHPRIKNTLEKIYYSVSRLHWRNSDFTKSVGIVGVASYSVVLVALLAAAIALFWWMFPLAAYSKGRSVAQERIRLFMVSGCHADSKTKWDTCSEALDGKGAVLHEGLLIAINDKEFAFFKKDGNYVVPRKEEIILRRKFH